jgi:K+-sensing histidine kinase KdpD
MSSNHAPDRERIAELEQELKARNAELSILKETSDAAAHQLNLDKLLQLVAERAQKLIKAETVLIPVLDKKCGEYTYRAGYGKNASEIVGESLPLEMGICGWVWRNKRAWWRGVLDELSEDERNKWEKEVGSVILVPLIGKQHFLGGIAGMNKTGGGEFNEGDLELLSLFATHVTSGVENAFLYQQLQDMNAELEQRVMARTAELEATNQELESFCYSVSHDLRAPLRAIDGFSQALIDDCRDQINDIGLDHLKRVRGASQRMGHLIEDMLRLSHTTRMPFARKTVNLSELALTSISRLREIDPQREVEVRIQPDITSRGDPQLLAVLLDNLIGNAWKYTGKTERPVIEFSTQTHNGSLEYCIKDNGAGFNMNYADRIFDAFKRLHGEEFEGSGVGLTTVQRIINRHGGNIRAQGEINKGATFCFSLGESRE